MVLHTDNREYRVYYCTLPAGGAFCSAVLFAPDEFFFVSSAENQREGEVDKDRPLETFLAGANVCFALTDQSLSAWS